MESKLHEKLLAIHELVNDAEVQEYLNLCRRINSSNFGIHNASDESLLSERFFANFLNTVGVFFAKAHLNVVESRPPESANKAIARERIAEVLRKAEDV